MDSSQDRRQVESRRVSVSAEINEDKRASDGRRSGVDRRGAFLNVTHDSEDFLFLMCTWLNTMIKGTWYIGPNESEPDASPVSFRVRFDEEADLAAFNEWLEIWREAE